MKLAFAILTHKPPDLLFEKLMDFVTSFPNVTVVVHHDYSKCDFPLQIIEKYNLQMVLPYHSTRWGHISKMSAIVGAISKVMSVTPDFDWLISLSANCYPLKNRSSILQFFTNAKADFFMECAPIGLEFGGIYKWHYQTLFSKWLCRIPFFSKKGQFKWRHIRMPTNRLRTPFNDAMYPFAGSDWYFLNNHTVRVILEADLLNHPMTAFVAKANEAPDKNASPDEIIIQTFLSNQKQLKGNGNYHRFIDWENATEWHPNTISMRHWDAIKKTDALFGRKFEWDKSKEILSRIDDEILNREYEPLPTDSTEETKYY